MEFIGLAVIGLGCLIALIGWIWLLIIGVKHGGALWGILIFFFSGLAGLIFCIMYKTGWLQWLMLIIGGVLAGFGMIPMVMGQLQNMPASY